MTTKIIQHPNSKIDITIINTNAVKINGKCVIRTGRGGWVRQMAPYTDAEIEALREITERLDQNRKE